MKSLLLPLLLLSLLTLTLSLPAPNLAPFSGPPLAGNTGIDTGISMIMYQKPKCDKSSAVQTVELQYNHQIAQEFHSYRLNGTFSSDQKVSIYAPADWKATGHNGVDAAAVGDVGVGVSSCAEMLFVFFSLFFFFLFFGFLSILVLLRDWIRC